MGETNKRSKNNPDGEYILLLGRLEGSIKEISKGMKSIKRNQREVSVQISNLEKYIWALPCTVHDEKINSIIKRVDSHEEHHKEREKRQLTIIGLLITAIAFIIETVKWAWSLFSHK